MEHLEIPSEHEHQGHTPLKPHQGQHRTANQELIELQRRSTYQQYSGKSIINKPGFSGELGVSPEDRL
jgi:hypothetical protein